jgi:hypothetical protein
MVRETTSDYDTMSSTVPENLRKIWDEEMTHAERRRLVEPSVMDILGAQQMDTDTESDPGPVQHQGAGTGAEAEWLNLALSIEERQYVLFKYVHVFFLINTPD